MAWGTLGPEVGSEDKKYVVRYTVDLVKGEFTSKLTLHNRQVAPEECVGDPGVDTVP